MNPENSPWKDAAVDAPDSRAIRSRNEKKHILLGWMQEVFCANCGKPQGMVTKDWAVYIHCLCDDCVLKHGRPMDMVELPEEIARGPKSFDIGG